VTYFAGELSMLPTQGHTMNGFSATNGINASGFPMKLYKYRKLEPFEYIADIIYENRFHTAQFSDLNDPMEGLFNIRGEMDGEHLREIKKAIEGVRICSFSRTATHPVLWAHYADNFKGVCIEVEIKETESGLRLASIDYTLSRSSIRPEQAGVTCLYPDPLLARKAEEWELEQEVRAFAAEEFICCRDSMKITRVLLGLRTPCVMQRLIRQITPPHVAVCKTRVGEQNEIQVDSEIPLAS
jgi:hypothetical protein